jgi:hypothetical protein
MQEIFTLKDLNYLYFSPNVIWVIKSIKARWAGHVALADDRRDASLVLVWKTDGNRPITKLS